MDVFVKGSGCLCVERTFRSTVSVILMTVLCSLASLASSSQLNIDADNIAVSGYDVVSYFDARVEQGSVDFSSHYQGAIYLFSSASHAQQFESDPQKFVPAYGGYCAYGVSMGKRLPIDPRAYEIVAGRLYLLLNRVAQKTWQLNRDENIKIADRLWQTAEHKP